MKPTVLRDDFLLLATSAIWGLAFVAQRVGMEHVGPFTFNGVRFALGSLSLVPLVLLFRRRRRGTRRAAAPRVLLWGILAGTVLFGGASLQQMGIVHTTAGKAGFITGLYVVLVPLTGLLWGQRAGAGRWVGATVAMTGLFLLSVTRTFTVGRGDLLVLASALFWTAHVQLLGWLSPRVDPLELSAVQFAVCSILSLVVAVIVEPVAPAAVLRAAVPILYGGVGSVGVAYTLQVVAQRSAHPAHAAILLSLESVFAVLGGWLILGETLAGRGVLGCGLMLAGMLLSQTSSLRNPAQRRTAGEG